MKYVPLYFPAKPPKPHFLKGWARWTLFGAIAIPSIYYGTRAYFGAMPMAETFLRVHGILP